VPTNINAFPLPHQKFIAQERFDVKIKKYFYLLKGEAIRSKKPSSEEKEGAPLGAAIIAVADAYDAMIADRPYRAGRPPWKAFEEIEKESGKQFHTGAVKAFKKVLTAKEKYKK